jgi:hypothetical protein
MQKLVVKRIKYCRRTGQVIADLHILAKGGLLTIAMSHTHTGTGSTDTHTQLYSLPKSPYTILLPSAGYDNLILCHWFSTSHEEIHSLCITCMQIESTQLLMKKTQHHLNKKLKKVRITIH